MKFLREHELSEENPADYVCMSLPSVATKSASLNLDPNSLSGILVELVHSI